MRSYASPHRGPSTGSDHCSWAGERLGLCGVAQARQAAQSATSAPGRIWQRQTTYLTGPDQVTDLRGCPAIRPRTSGGPEGPAAPQNHRASTRAPPRQPTPCTTAGRCGSRRRREAPHHLRPGRSTERSVLRGPFRTLTRVDAEHRRMPAARLRVDRWTTEDLGPVARQSLHMLGVAWMGNGWFSTGSCRHRSWCAAASARNAGVPPANSKTDARDTGTALPCHSAGKPREFAPDRADSHDAVL